ncbi:type II secretion system protein F (GspF) [Selenomonas ruminantium]|uniref:Type II secretion system protein F (GspF) n=1 Tax=Selenomonas ruminantium TaxID=971 RepID=A0A1M6VAR9_SELRU|nr:type II secretion system F family protein [Selenomonas ruminantium]SHK78464.1 type II secretion system protein F (GspF) [Selenomonas ruminantium]
MNYRYEASNRQGQIFKGTVSAPSRQEAARKIKRQGLWITALLRAEDEKEAAGRKDWCQYLMTRKVDDMQIALFCRQLAVLLSAGIPVHEGLKALLAGRRGERYSRLLNGLYQQVLQGKSLATAMEASGNFSPRIVQLVAAGEQAGTLEAVFSRLADFLAQVVTAREQLKSVLLYPAILGLTALGMLIFMAVFILPAFASMLQNLQAELPWPTRVLLSLADFLQVHGGDAMAGGIVLVLGLLLLARQAPVIYRYHQLVLYLPMVGALARNSAWSLLLGTLGMVLEQGLPLHQAIRLAAPVAGNRYLERELLQVQAKVEQGSALMAALISCPVFPAILVEMLEAGEEAGKLEVMLAKAAAFCQVQAENESARLQALAEPVAIFIVGGLVFFLVLAVIMPLLNTMDALSI